ncbi:hypothetical protein, partial [Vibrio sp. 10N.222.49.A4]|uniref:hypothetical protein n=1 Tax=Vibrio sp. 10N.222.49.A4 TaxID=3229612 RepID=UPI00354C7F80
VTGVKPAVDSQGTQVDEGEGAVFEVSLSNPSSTDMTFDFALAEGTAIEADFDKDPSNVTFSNGVTYDPVTKQITVPAGVTTFTATVATTRERTRRSR